MLCTNCGNYLGGVGVSEASSGKEPSPIPEDVGATCRLECLTTGKIYTIRSSDVLGQAHATSNAEVQLEGIPGVEYISRSHCRLERSDDVWFATCLESALNPTHCNRVRMAPGGRIRVRDGDELTLAAVSFRIRIP